MRKVGFQVSTRMSGQKRIVRVVVYDDIQELRRDGDKYNQNMNHEQSNDGVLGLAHRYERIDIESDTSHPEVGTIRLHKDFLRSGIICHEVAHIALWIYETDIKKPLTTEDNENEEKFCHILGELTAKIVNKLYAKELL